MLLFYFFLSFIPTFYPAPDWELTFIFPSFLLFSFSLSFHYCLIYFLGVGGVMCGIHGLDDDSLGIFSNSFYGSPKGSRKKTCILSGCIRPPPLKLGFFLRDSSLSKHWITEDNYETVYIWPQSLNRKDNYSFNIFVLLF